MFSFGKSQESREINAFVRRLADITCPNLPRSDVDNRADLRQNRTLPVLLTPFDGNVPAVHESTTAITKDICDHGISLVLNQPFLPDLVILGFWPAWDGTTIDQQPTFIRGSVRQNYEIGGGFWQIGVQFDGKITPEDYYNVDHLFARAARLIPRSILRQEDSALAMT